jgi:hypothetical protein
MQGCRAAELIARLSQEEGMARPQAELGEKGTWAGLSITKWMQEEDVRGNIFAGSILRAMTQDYKHSW